MFRLSKFALFILAAAMFYVAPAHAQATRTWVSGVGDDVNPCSRTAPCKTFAGAISKTAAGGEINCLDPGGFGAVTINKALVIDCHYTEGGALAGGNGVTVNAGAADVVVLRGLDLFGVNPPSNGVRFIAGGELHIEDCTIRRFNLANSFGVSFQPSAFSKLFITRTFITTNGNGGTGGGVLIQPTGTGGASAVITDSELRGNAGTQLRINSTGNTGGGITVNVENTRIVGGQDGVRVINAAGTASIGVMMVDSNVSGNAVGIVVDGSAALMRVGNTTIMGNASGVSTTNSGTLSSYGDNRLDGNPTVGAPNNGSFTGVPIQKR